MEEKTPSAVKNVPSRLKLHPGIVWGIYGLMTLAMLIWTWKTWPDSIVDFGKELYMAWRIAAGQHLYLDLAHYSGPLSSYLNGMWFRWVGMSLYTLLGLNFLVWLLLFCLLQRTLSKMASPLAVVVAMSFFILVFSFGQYAGIGNYTYLAPYAHELTHGLALSLGAIYLTRRWMESGRLWDMALAGICLGLSFLTKPEVALPGFVAVGAGLLAHAWIKRRWARAASDGVAVLGLCGAGAVLIALLLLFTCMPWGIAWNGVLTPWRNLFFRSLVQMPFFQQLAGLDRPMGNLGVMIGWAVGYAALLAGPYAVGRFFTKAPAVAITLILCTLGLVAARHLPAQDIARPWPMFVALGLLLSARNLWLRQGADGGRGELLRWMFGVFSFTLLLKMLLNTRIWHYGFVLAMPATLYLIMAMLDWIPRRFAAHLDRGWGWRIATGAILGGILYLYWGQMSIVLSRKQYEMGSGRDSFRSDGSGLLVNQFIEGAHARIPSGATLAVIPEGAMLNYLMRLENPTPYTNLMPPEMLVYGERVIVDAFGKNPPDFIALVHKDTSEFGVRFFGRDYGFELARWIKNHYEEVFLVGNAPFWEPEQFGLLLLRRLDLKAVAPRAAGDSSPR